LLLMMIISTALAFFILMPDELARMGRSLTASSLFVPNLALWRETGYFDSAANEKPLLHLWSLGVEEQFYLVWPLLLVALSTRLERARLVVVVGAIAMMSFALQVWIARYSPAASFYLPFTRFWELMIGTVLAVRSGDRTPESVGEPRPGRRQIMPGVIAALGLCLIGAPVVFLPPDSGMQMWFTPLAVAGAASIIAAGPRCWPNRLLSVRPIVYVGLISYPLYLWHWPPRSLLRVLGLTDVPLDRALRLAALAASVVAAMLTYHCVELPLRRRRLLPLAIGLCLGLVVVAAGGVVIHEAAGWPARLPFATNPFLYEQSMRNDRRCLDLYYPGASSDGPFCLRNDYSRAPSVVLLGDSHANALWQGVLASYSNESVLQIGGAACPPLRAVDFVTPEDPGRRGKCPAIVDRAYRAIDGARLVIMDSRATLYTATPDEKRSDFDLNPGTFFSTAFPGASPLEDYEKSLRRDLAFLLEGGREVVLLLPNPDMHFDPRECVRMRPVDAFFAVRSPLQCTQPRAAVIARQLRVREMYSRVAADLGNARLHLVDPVTVLCDEQLCHALIDGKVLYRDDDHLSAVGAGYVWSRIDPFRHQADVPSSQAGD